MRVPIRRAELNGQRDDGPLPMTAAALTRLEHTLQKLEGEVMPLATEVARLKENGDLSENFEYQDAKHRLRALHGRIAGFKDKIKRAVVIAKSESGVVQLGSTVVLETNGKQMAFEILGSQEADPSRGRISDHSPLGQALLGHRRGDSVSLSTKTKETLYHIIDIQ